DVVVRVSGKVSARDRDGNLGSEAKLIADEVFVVTDKELETYESTGVRMAAPKPGKPKPTVKRNYSGGGNYNRSAGQTNKSAPSVSSGERVDYKPLEVKMQKLFVHVKDPDNHDILLKMKQTLNNYPGMSEIILVLGEERKSAIRLPFKTE